MEKEKLGDRDWKVIAKRICANIITLILLAGSAFAVFKAVERSKETSGGGDAGSDGGQSWLRQNEITIVMNVISMGVPYAFDLVALLEGYHPRKAMRWMLARIMVLNLLSLLTLIVSLFAKTNGIIDSLHTMYEQKESGANFGLDQETTTAPPDRDCFKVPVPCWLVTSEEDLPPLPLHYELGGLDSTGLGLGLDIPRTPAPPTVAAAPGNVARNRTDDPTVPIEEIEDSLIQEWLRNLTRPRDKGGGGGEGEDGARRNVSSSSSVANCSSCLSHCGHDCFDVCNVLADCSEDYEAKFRASEAGAD